MVDLFPLALTLKYFFDADQMFQSLWRYIVIVNEL